MGFDHINVYYVAVHRSQGQSQDIRFSLHVSRPIERNAEMVSSKVPEGIDAWTWAHEKNPPDATWKAKMQACWDGFNTIYEDFKYALYQYMVDMKPPM
ncbi:MAG: hypothetical protein JXB39_15630 [Deltaproteobacteria bacterium]|nr:hypothetical protein [Deltaproteobacteria bacterium]